MPDAKNPNWPLQSFDAQDWAKSFMERFGAKRDEIDESLMVSWFANALMRGHDEGRGKVVKTFKPYAGGYELQGGPVTLDAGGKRPCHCSGGGAQLPPGALCLFCGKTGGAF